MPTRKKLYLKETVNDDLFVVGIGTSAGGLSVLEELFDHLPSDSGAAFVVIQHLSPDFKSLMKELLQRHTGMEVHRVTQDMQLQPNSVYLIPPGKNLVLETNLLRLEERKKNENDRYELNFPIDLFFTSLANNYKERSIGVILSGSGSDGTHGLKIINEAGGVSLVQDPETAEFDGMPRSAIATGVVNQILPPQELAQLIYQCILSPADCLEIESNDTSFLTSSHLQQMANLLLETEKIDFSHYKTSTISRRIHRRRLINNFPDIASYLKFLHHSEEERKVLCSDLLINVTHFFRDQAAWNHLENNILPVLIEQAKPQEELRFWVAACSTGEEAYSLAILIHEALEDLNKSQRVKIFATDIDHTALKKASTGIYPQSIVNHITPERLQKYFIPKDESFQVIRTLREMLIFSPQDLTKDAGFTRMHLISCRNVLIYMQSDLQQQILRNLHFSLLVKGVLFLGEAESLGIFTSEFTALNKKWKIYQKRRDIKFAIPPRTISKFTVNSYSQTLKPKFPNNTKSIHEHSLQRMLNDSHSVIMLVSSDYQLLYVYGNSSKLFKPPYGEIVTDVTKMVVLPLQLPLNTALHRAKKEKKSIIYSEIKLEQGRNTYYINLKVIPPENNWESGNFYLVQINRKEIVPSLEKTPVQIFEANNEAQRRILELEHELQHTRENLQALIEELETTNEEQQASNEELTASNEELQSTNEELHSVNEELHTVNIEYQSKILELTQLNDDIDNLLKSTEIGVIFLDSELKIRKFTPAATAAVSVRHTDLERPLKELTLKIECPNLQALLEEVNSNQKSIELEVKHLECDSYLLVRIHPYHTENQQRQGIVISFVKIDEIKVVQLQLENTLTELQSKKQEINNFFNLSLELLCVATPQNNCFRRINPSFERILGYTQEELLNQPFLNFIHPDDVQSSIEELKRLEKDRDTIGFKNRYRCKDGSYRYFQWMATSYQGLLYASARDLTEQKLAQELQSRQLAAIETASDGIAILSDDRFIYLNQAHLEIFGYTQPEELIGQSWHILYEPEELGRFEREIFPILQQRGKWQGEALAKHRDGHTFNEELTLTFTPAGDLISSCRDITEIKQAQEQILQANAELEQRVAQRTQSLANFSNCLQQIHRLAVSNYQQLDDLFSNYLQAGCQMFNLPTGIVSEVNDSIYNIVAVESPLDLEVGYKSPCLCTYCGSVVEENLSTITYNQLGESKSIKNPPTCLDLKLESFIITPIFVNGNLYGRLIFCDTKFRKSEFTEEERKIIELMAKDIGNSIASVQTEAALRKNEKLFRSTFEQAAIGIAHLNPEFRFLKVNQGFCQMLGYSEAELLQKGFADVTDPEDSVLDLEYVRQMLAGEFESYSCEKRYIDSNGLIVWAHLTVTLIKHKSGKAEYFVAIVGNISDRKQAEIDLKESKTKLQKANQAKDAFIAHMSHELRTPLNSILGFSSILQKDSDLTTQQLDSIRIINQSGQHLLTLINDILDLSKITANKLQLEPQEFNFIQFLNEIATIFRLRAQQKYLKFSTSISPSLPKIVSADETRLRQVLLNLLGNAVKFTSNGTITFKVSNIKTKQQKKRLKPGKIQKIRFQIEDTGIGIPSTKFTEIFLPFRQLRNITENPEGTGLGLNISQNIIQLMGSQIQLKSKVGQGTKFWFDLEILEADANILPTSSGPNYQNIRCLREPQKILVVDDRNDNRALLVRYLEPLGFIIAEANNGETGLAIAETFKPDAILVDLVMPVMDGKEMITRIKQHHELQNTVTIMISANSQSILKQSEMNCHGFLSKPVDLEQLLELLESNLQLDWQSVETVTEEDLYVLVVPPQQELIQLLELAKFGDIEAIKEQINFFEETNSQYIPFVQKVRQLVLNCQQEQLEILFQKLIN
ncbi:chemotaxis protein CheB [Mastigocoleus testarum]|uniref:Circadian input-output histidine kinase CikA n=1 Tax=Mastigocoleus testarum BC008 TaxID=371196 RepID=A0A0V7ZZ26_9CYAN|nr:chemotaxis protein CheB [Mastigocoleus testarum]KST67552.1 hypothetical protein BC008_30620 [Mastigocoleus testarum BC008]KST69812.1 hypothetical protein BC008_36230 [Mastigocoleus testarum BC008]